MAATAGIPWITTHHFYAGAFHVTPMAFAPAGTSAFWFSPFHGLSAALCQLGSCCQLVHTRLLWQRRLLASAPAWEVGSRTSYGSRHSASAHTSLIAS